MSALIALLEQQQRQERLNGDDDELAPMAERPRSDFPAPGNSAFALAPVAEGASIPPFVYQPERTLLDDGASGSLLPESSPLIEVGGMSTISPSLFDLGESGPVPESLLSLPPYAPTPSVPPEVRIVGGLPSPTQTGELDDAPAGDPSTATLRVPTIPPPAVRSLPILPVALGFALVVGGVSGLVAHRMTRSSAATGSASAKVVASSSSMATESAASAFAASPAIPPTAVSARLAPTPMASSAGPILSERPVRPRLSPHCPEGMALVGDASSGFCLDQREVTVRDWVYCVAKNDCAPLGADVAHAGVRPDVARRHAVFCAANRRDLELPVNCVSWASASRYCRSRGARLPTAREWLRAALGEEGERAAPWGPQPLDGARANVCDERCSAWGMEAGLLLNPLHSESDGYAGPIAPGSYPKGRSADRVDDLFGNVSEWLADGNERERATLGGSFLSTQLERLREPVLYDARATTPTIGVRCATLASPAARD